MSKFEDDLHKAAQDRADEAAAEAEATESVLRRFRDRNVAARIEAKRRLHEIAADLSSFLTKRGVPPQQVVAGLKPGPGRPRLVEVCQGWNFADYFFLVTTGQFCYLPPTPVPGYHPPGYVNEMAPEVKPGQLYLGNHTAKPQLVEYLLGVEEAVFVPEGQRPQTNYGVDKWRRFYFGDLYRPSLPAPLPAMLLTSAAPELWLASGAGTTDKRYVSVVSLDQWIAYEALQIEKRRATR